jgi:DNA-binding transcriptional LysR family regulator
VVCLVAENHPAVRRGWNAKNSADWLEAEHIAPMAMHPGARGVIDDYLLGRGLKRNITVRCPHFGLMPAMVASSLLVMTTGRQFCERAALSLPVKILPCPIEFPRMMYYQLWHERSHASSASKWLRERVKAVATALRKQ